MKKVEENTTSVEVETGQPININLEGIKLDGVSKEDAQRIAEAAAKQAFEVVEASYKETIVTLESANADLQTKYEALESERNTLQAEKVERERQVAFAQLFDEFAIAGEARDSLYKQAFAGMNVEQARSVLKHFGVVKAAATVDAPDDEDVAVRVEKTEQLDDPIALGRAIAEQLMPEKAQN